MREWAGDAGLATHPASPLWRLGPRGLAARRRHALRPSAESVAALYTVHRAEGADPYRLHDVMPDVFPPPPSAASDVRALSSAERAVRVGSMHDRIAARVNAAKAEGRFPAP